MSVVVYTKLKELELQDKEVFEFGNWLRNFNEEAQSFYDSEFEEDHDFDEDRELPSNKMGEVMEYPWEEFSYVVVPDTDAAIAEGENIASHLGSYLRYDIEDSDRVFFVVK